MDNSHQYGAFLTNETLKPSLHYIQSLAKSNDNTPHIDESRPLTIANNKYRQGSSYPTTYTNFYK
jgi:hypothetical protein